MSLKKNKPPKRRELCPKGHRGRKYGDSKKRSIKAEKKILERLKSNAKGYRQKPKDSTTTGSLLKKEGKNAERGAKGGIEQVASTVWRKDNLRPNGALY